MKSNQWLHYMRCASGSLRSAIGLRTMCGLDDFNLTYNVRAVKALRGVLPYCLHPATIGADSPMIWLNREYKPIGVLTTGGHVDYMDFPHLHVPLDDPRIVAIIPDLRKVILYSDTHPIFFLHNDSTAPTNGKKNALRLLQIIERAMG